MSGLPDELWRQILDVGIRNSQFSYKDLCWNSISCRRLHRLSGEDSLWSHLLSSDFRPKPHLHPSSLLLAKSAYKIRFEKEKERKVAAHRRAVLRKESEITERQRKIRELEIRLRQDTERMRDTSEGLSNLHKASFCGFECVATRGG